jgi:hypothetical protein
LLRDRPSVTRRVGVADLRSRRAAHDATRRSIP